MPVEPIADGPAVSRPEPSVEEKRALIEQVAASGQFSRSARLRDFLLYIGRQSLRTGCPDIHEQEIGVRVFGRSAAYDRSQDNIVRVNASELRKRVDAYFGTLGAQEPLIFEIPRGAYKPVFRWRAAEVETASSEPANQTDPHTVPAEPLPEAKKPARWLNGERLVWGLSSAGLLIVCLLLWQQNRAMQNSLQPGTNQPAVNAFWNAFLDPHRETDIVLPDDSVSIIEDIAGSPIQLNDYMSGSFMRRLQSSADIGSDRKSDLNQIFSHNLVTFGAVRATQAIMGVIPPNYPRYLTLSRSFTADQFIRGNAVLIGGAKSLPWDHLFDDLLEFHTDYDYKRGVQSVFNRSPKQNEQAAYAVSGAQDSLTGYAVIAYLPNPSRTGHALIIAGTDSDATGAAAAFLTSEEKMARFRTLMQVDRFPYFEAILRTSRVSGTFFGAEPIAYRTYPELR